MASNAVRPQHGRTFVGREQELAQLRAAYDACAGGEGGLVMVAGEPGIGKTALCEQLAEYAVGQGGRPMFGYCYEEGASTLPYLPFVVALRDYVAERDAELLRAEFGSDAPYLARIVREVRERLGVEVQPPGDPAEDRWRLLEAITRCFGAIAVEAPVLLVLEDLHWADRGTLDALQHLARSLGEMRLLVVGTYRDIEVDRAHPLSSALAELRRSGGRAGGASHGYRRIALRGLTLEEVHALYEATRGNQVPRAQAELVHNQTEGNPLFVQEVLRYLVDEGYVVKQGDAYVYASSLAPESVVPEGLRDVVGKRLNHLSEGCNQLLSSAAVIGREFRLDTLQRVAAVGGAPRDEEAVIQALEQALRAGILEEMVRPGAVQYRFTHAFFRQTLHEELSAARRLRTHQQIARVLEEQYAGRLEDHAAELAEHLTNSTDAEDLKKAISFGVLAAEQAGAVFAYSEEARLLERAIEVQEVVDAGEKGRQCDLLLLLCDALIKAGEAPRVCNDVAKRALDLAEALGDAERASRACQYAISGLRGAKGFGGWAEPDVAEWTEAGVRYARQGTLARVWADGAQGRMKFARGEGAEGLRLVDRALGLAQQLDDDTAVWVGGVFWLETHMAPQFASSSLAVARELMQRRSEHVSPLIQRPALAMLQHPFWHAGDRTGAEAVLERGITLAERTRQPNLEIHALSHAAFRALLDGRLEEAVGVTSAMLARAEDLGLVDFVIGGGFTGSSLRALIYLGRPQELDELPIVGDALLGLQHAVCGRYDESEACIDRVLARRAPVAPADDLSPVWNDLPLLEAALLLGHVEAVRFACSRFGGASVDGINRIWGISIPRLLGDAAAFLGDLSDARRYYETATRVCESMGFWPEQALAQIGLAEVLSKQTPRDRREIDVLLETAIAELEAMGMEPALQRALALRQAGPHAPQQSPAYPDGLSGREVEVLRLVAAGKSNQQIADELVVSLNTIRRHVSNIFDKIGVTNRTEAASYAHHNELT